MNRALKTLTTENREPRTLHAVVVRRHNVRGA